MVTEQLNVEYLNAEQVRVGKHVRIRSAIGKLDVHASDTVVGVWLSSEGRESGSENMLAAFVRPNETPTLAFYPPAKYWGPTAKRSPRLPFALSGHGLQVPHQDGTVTILPLERLSEIVRTLSGK